LSAIKKYGNFKKDKCLLADLERVKGIEYRTMLVKSMLPDEVVCLFLKVVCLRFDKLKIYNFVMGGMGM